MPPALATRLGVSIALVAGTWGGVVALDAGVEAVRARVEKRPVTPPNAGPVARPAGRAFVLVVDSFRLETALGLSSVRALGARGVLARLRSSQDAATVPSLRAAFTGVGQRSLFAFARNFLQGGGSIPSVFSVVAARGGRSAVFSDGAFAEMGHDISRLSANERAGDDEEAGQLAAFAEALALYRAAEHALVVFHYTASDHAAHAHGVGTAEYRRAFERVDVLLREVDAALPASETFCVLGDHGHDAAGRHVPGQPAPTVIACRGPGLVAGRDLGEQPLTLTRYLLGWALGHPDAGDYDGEGAPAALRVAAELPNAFRARPPVESAVPHRLMRLGVLLPLVGLVVLVGVLAARRLTRRRWPAALASTVVVGAGLVAWGGYLAARRFTVPPATERELLGTWLAAAILLVGGIALGRLRWVHAAWLALGLPALLLYPSSAWYGWAAAMGPAWIVGLGLLAIAWLRHRTGHAASLAFMPLAIVFILPFFYAEASSFRFVGWRGYLTSDRVLYWLAVSAAAKLVLFVPAVRRTPAALATNLVGLAVVLLFTLVSFGGLFPTQTARLAAVVVLALAAAWARRSEAPLASLLANAALLMGYRATVALDERSFLELELLLAALCLTAVLVRDLGRREVAASAGAWLEALGLLVAAWGSLALTLHRLEWKILYRFFAPAVVEQHVFLFLPVIVLRYLIPLVLARRLVAEMRSPGETSTWRGGVAAVAVKLAALLLVTVGYAVYDPTSEQFLEAVQQLLTLSVLGLAFVYEPPRESGLVDRPAHLLDVDRVAVD